MSYNSRLFNLPKLKAIVEITDDISQLCEEVADDLANYESASDESGEDATEAREQARDEAWTHINSLLAHADKLKALQDGLYE